MDRSARRDTERGRMNGDARQSWKPWVWVGAVAALMHLILIYETRHVAAFAFPLVDSSTYHQMAEAFLKGAGPRTPYWQPPLFPWFLAAVYGLLGREMVLVRAVLAVVGVIGAELTLAIGRRLAGPRVGLAAGLGAALYGPLLFYQTQLMPVGLAVALNLVLLLLVWRALALPSGWRWLGAGLAQGVAALAVPNALAMAVAAVPAAWQAERRAGGPGWRGPACFVLGLALLVLPVSIRNRIVGGTGVWISSNGGINFFIGNNPHMEVTLGTRPGVDWERLTQVPYRNGARNAAEADRYFWRESFRFLAQRPGQFLRHTVWKARLFLAGREIPRNLDYYTFQNHSRVLDALAGRWSWGGWPFGVVGSLGLLGLVLAWRRSVEQRVTVGFVVVYALSVILFFPAARYRAPLIPFFLIYAALAVEWLVRRVREPGRRWWWGMAGLGAAALVVNAPVTAPTDGIRFDAELENAIGAACQMRGRRGEALRHYERAREADPQLADAAYNLGVLMDELRRGDEAARLYRETLRIRPDHDKARINLALAFYRDGRLGEAANMLELATVLNPGNAKAWHNRAVVLRAMGRHEEARACWREAAARDTAYAPLAERPSGSAGTERPPAGEKGR